MCDQIAAHAPVPHKIRLFSGFYVAQDITTMLIVIDHRDWAIDQPLTKSHVAKRNYYLDCSQLNFREGAVRGHLVAFYT